VVETRNGAGVVRRVRKCRACGRRVPTVERVAGERHRLDDLPDRVPYYTDL
jgi:transcriptional regulator NrdR family protein